MATAKFVRMSPRKLRRVINVIRGKNTIQAQNVLRFMPYAAARVIEKVLKSAVANAVNNNHLDSNELKVSKAFVDQSTTLRRWRAMSRGRGYPILKRTSHITLEVEIDPNAKVEHKFEKKIVHKDKHKHKHEQEEKTQKKEEVSKKKEKIKKEVKESKKEEPKKKKEGKKKED